MATTSATVTATDSGLQDLAKRHLWMHFTRQGAYEDARRADHRPRRGRLRLGRAGQPLPGRALRALLRQRRSRPHGARRRGRARRSRELDFFTIWSYAHPRAIELAARIAALAPGDLNRVFFTNSGSEAVESAIKLARAYHQRTGNGHGRPSSSPARSPTTAPRSARWPRPASPRSATSSSRWSPAGSRCRTPTATTGPRAATRSGRLTRSRRGSSSRTPTPSPRSSSSRSRTRAAASRRRTATSSACGRSATATTCC